MSPKFHQWQQASKNGKHVLKIAVIRSGFSNRKMTGILYIIYCGYFKSFFVSHYILLVLFKRRVCNSVIAESFKQIYQIIFLSACEGWNLTEVQV